MVKLELDFSWLIFAVLAIIGFLILYAAYATPVTNPYKASGATVLVSYLLLWTPFQLQFSKGVRHVCVALCLLMVVGFWGMLFASC